MAQDRGLSMSADKKELFRRLNLTESDHKALLEEAANARNRLSLDPNSLTPQSRANGVEQPYKWDQLSETAKHQQILFLAHSAGSSTRQYYDLGRFYTNINEENWVARWYLWHSFRNRDNRNNKGQAVSDRPNPYEDNQGQNRGAMYDPVRRIYR